MLSIIKVAIVAATFLFMFFVLFFERKQDRRRFVWLLILYILPGVGIILYILFSGHVFTGTRRMQEVNTTADNITKPLRDLQKRRFWNRDHGFGQSDGFRVQVL